MDPELTELTGRLTALLRARSGDPQARASGVEPLPGHAGVSYRFVHEGRDGALPLVLRLAPAGVPAVGPNDVVRQARIMAALGGTATPSGVAVPPIHWYGDDPQWFGRPFFVAGFVAGDKPALGQRRFDIDEMRRCSAAAVATAAALHRRISSMSKRRWPSAGLSPATKPATKNGRPNHCGSSPYQWIGGTATPLGVAVPPSAAMMRACRTTSLGPTAGTPAGASRSTSGSAPSRPSCTNR